jgi:hypothetical protein
MERVGGTAGAAQSAEACRVQNRVAEDFPEKLPGDPAVALIDVYVNVM